MQVVITSQCTGTAIKKTRRVIDSFLPRIGDFTWQGHLTKEGLEALRFNLKRSAAKNTAVACRWVRNSFQTDLVWIVGNKKRFNSYGEVPVHQTRQENKYYEGTCNYKYRELVKALSGLSALLHDIGKSSDFFQSKLKVKKSVKDPLRHEFVSVLMLVAFFGDKPSDDWYDRLITDLSSDSLSGVLGNLASIKDLHKYHIMKALPETLQYLCWLILSHHKLPFFSLHNDCEVKKVNSPNAKELLCNINALWGFKHFDEAEYQKAIDKCLSFSKGTPADSAIWLKEIKRWAAKLKAQNAVFKEAIETGVIRGVIHQARLALMLGDHQYSSKISDKKFNSSVSLYANTKKENGKPYLDQKLDEHLVHVAKGSIQIAEDLREFEGTGGELPFVNIPQMPSSKDFIWQENAVEKIAKWRKQSPPDNKDQFGFFCINVASTGTGKTIANAKIMKALSPDENSLRYSLLLGLRSLTLQTGDSYRRDLELDSDDMAVLIGSQAHSDLHHNAVLQKAPEEDLSLYEEEGSASAEPLLNEDDVIHYEGSINTSNLSTKLTTNKQRQLLFAPILACTIDHMMPAVQCISGGKYILPTLRLMGSDVVIDEIDAFSDSDLLAVSHLIHLAGMLGRKVMISSATITCEMARGLYHAYRCGWDLFALGRDQKRELTVAWVDEFKTTVKTFSSSLGKEPKQDTLTEKMYAEHCKFIKSRNKKLKEEDRKRIGYILRLDAVAKTSDEGEDDKPMYERLSNRLYDGIDTLHDSHHEVLPSTGQSVSLGLIRMANTTPAYNLYKNLISHQDPEGVVTIYTLYHSRQVLLNRHNQEVVLDSVLSRKPKGGESALLANPRIQSILKDYPQATDIRIVVIATPVEEVGRDHDFDWAIIEPSSFQSIVQCVGRVRRHRSVALNSDPNVAILQYNVRALMVANHQKKEPVFIRPGFEGMSDSLVGIKKFKEMYNSRQEMLMETHDVEILLKRAEIEKGIDPSMRINPIADGERDNASRDLISLEKLMIEAMLATPGSKASDLCGMIHYGTLAGYCHSPWHLTGQPAISSKFREGSNEITLHLDANDDGEYSFKQVDPKTGLVTTVTKTLGKSGVQFQAGDTNKEWINRDYLEGIKAISPEATFDDLPKLFRRFGVISVYNTSSRELEYSDVIGMVVT